MIELRWIRPECTTTESDVLQYRELQNPFEIGLQEPIWTEWKPVPLVIVPSNAAREGRD